MKAWLSQDSKQLKKHGDKAPWSVCWYYEGRQRPSQSDQNRLPKSTDVELKVNWRLVPISLPAK